MKIEIQTKDVLAAFEAAPIIRDNQVIHTFIFCLN
jgi:hypothetical protein